MLDLIKFAVEFAVVWAILHYFVVPHVKEQFSGFFPKKKKKKKMKSEQVGIELKSKPEIKVSDRRQYLDSIRQALGPQYRIDNDEINTYIYRNRRFECIYPNSIVCGRIKYKTTVISYDRNELKKLRKIFGERFEYVLE